MKARIISYKRGLHTAEANKCIVLVEGFESKSRSETLCGKAITWQSPAGKKITGKITKTHGGKGAVIARFEKGLPGQALGTDAVVE